MHVAVDRLNRAVALLEKSQANSTGMGGVSPLGKDLTGTLVGTLQRKKSSAPQWERDRQACEDIKEILSSWNLPSLHTIDLNRAIGVLFLCVSHRESSVRLLADQALDSIFRKFQLKFQFQRVIAILLTELSKNNAPRSFCAALYKLSYTIHLTRPQRASIYALHFMNSMCTALTRTEEAVHAAVHATFSHVMFYLGAHAGFHVEKADELQRVAFLALNAGGASARAACAVIAALCRHVPSILHKCFYRLAEIIFKADDTLPADRASLSGAMITFRLMWSTAVESLTEISLLTLRKILCRVLCCLYSTSNEVIFAALELLETVMGSCTPRVLLDFNPFHAIDTIEHASFSAQSVITSKDFIRDWSELDDFRRKFPKKSTQEPVDRFESSFQSEIDSPMSSAGVNESSIGETPRRKFSSMEREIEALCIEELDNWEAITVDRSADEDGLEFNANESVISEFSPIGLAADASMTSTGSETPLRVASDASQAFFSENDVSEMSDPLLNCENYTNVDEEFAAAIETASDTSTIAPVALWRSAPTSSSSAHASTAAAAADIGQRIPAELLDNFCRGDDLEGITFCAYAARLVARRFLFDANGSLRDDCDVRVAHKILALKFLARVVARNHAIMTHALTSYDGGQRNLSDAFDFVLHKDDALAVAAANFLLSAEKSALFAVGRISQSARIFQLLKSLSQNSSAIRLKGVFRAFANATEALITDSRLLEATCECALATLDTCDYFLAKIARVEFFAAIPWRSIASQLRVKLQWRCLDAFVFAHLFDADLRVVRAACAALSQLIANAELTEDATRIFATILPDWFAESRLTKIPMVLGLDSGVYSFRCEPGDFFIEANLARFLSVLYALAAENFHLRRGGFLAAAAALARCFPPALYPDAWLILVRSDAAVSSANFGVLSLGTGTESAIGLSATTIKNSFIGLLLELSNVGNLAVEELEALIQLLTAIFAGIAESIFVSALADHTTHAQLLQSSINADSAKRTKNSQNQWFPLDGPVLEGILVFYLRVINLYHTIVAEEKTRNLNPATKFSMSPATEKLTDLAKRITSTTSESSKSPRSTSFSDSSSTRQRMHNFSYLVGTGIHQNRATSYFHSTSLKNLESLFVGAYENFLASMKADRQERFLVIISTVLRGLAAVLEMLEFDVVRTFMDELLLYLRTIFDVSIHHSADLIHQLLKTIFGRNARHINIRLLQGMHVKEFVVPADASEMYFWRSVNDFTVFTAFVSHAQYMDAYAMKDAGWLAGGETTPTFRISVGELATVADCLHRYDPFITRLIKIYTLSSATKICASILDLLCTLLMNNVKYEAIDRDGKFFARILAQIRQFAANGGENGALLFHLFTFLIILSRIGYTTFADVLTNFCVITARVEEHSVRYIMDVVHVVQLESCRQIAQSADGINVISAQITSETTTNDDDKAPNLGLLEQDQTDSKSRAQREIRAFLCREFEFLFTHCPRASAHLWILLLNTARRSSNSDWWRTLSMEFLELYSNFVSSRKFTATTRSETNIAGPVGYDNSLETMDYYGVTVILSYCEASTFRPINKFYTCLEELFRQLQEPRLDAGVSYFPVSPTKRQRSSTWLVDQNTIALETVSKTVPLIFVALCRLDEDVVLLRLNDYSDNKDTMVLRKMTANFANALVLLTRTLQSLDSKWLEQYGSGTEEALVFLIQIFLHTIHAGKSLRIVTALKKALFDVLCGREFGINGVYGLNPESEFSSIRSNFETSTVLQLIKNLNRTFPQAHAFWFALLLALELPCGGEFYFHENFSSHTKSLICLLLMEKFGEKCQSKDSKKGYFSQEDPNKFFISSILQYASEEFCARLLKWTEDSSMARKFPLKTLAIIDALHCNNDKNFTAKLEKFFYVNYIPELLSRFTEYLITLKALNENKIGLETKVDICHQQFIRKLKQQIWESKIKRGQFLEFRGIQYVSFSSSKSTTKALSSFTLDNDYEFCMYFAQNSMSNSQICALLHFLKVDEILKIFNTICTQRKLPFFRTLFAQLRQLKRETEVIRHMNSKKLIEETTNKTNTFDLCDCDETRLGLKSTGVQILIEAIFSYLAKSPIKDSRNVCSPTETVALLAGLAKIVSPNLCTPDRFDSTAVDRILNNLIAYLKKLLKSEYFAALHFFFRSRAFIARLADDDLHSVENLHRFLRLLWIDTIEKELPRSRRLKRDVWRVDVDASGAMLRDEILQCFEIVQRVMHAFRADVLSRRRRNDVDFCMAFKALFRLPVFAKMAVAPLEALKRDWSLIIQCRDNSLLIPLINIHVLAADVIVLSDFVWRIMWIGWTTKAQFEEFWMSLFGVLSSTPTSRGELNAAAESGALDAQLHASCVAVDALSALVLSALLHPHAGDTVAGRFLVKHRQRDDAYLFLCTFNGKLASCAKFWLHSDEFDEHGAVAFDNEYCNDEISQIFTRNLESSGYGSALTTRHYDIGQTSLDYQWTITGLLNEETTATTTNTSLAESMKKRMKSSVSRYLLANSTTPDTTSSLKALFDNYLHWCSTGLTLLPIGLLTAVLKSMALLSDLVDDLFHYQVMFEKLRALFAGGAGAALGRDAGHIADNESARGYAIYLLLKCAAVVEWMAPTPANGSELFALLRAIWLQMTAESFMEPEPTYRAKLQHCNWLNTLGLRKDLINYRFSPHNSATDTISALLPLSNEQELAAFLDSIIEKSFWRDIANESSNFVGYCTLKGVLYLLQSLVIDLLPRTMERVAEFIMNELRRMHQSADILTADYPSDTIEYQKLVWTVSFRFIEDALPIQTTHRNFFLKMISTRFVDARLPTWLKRLLADGMHALVVHTSRHASAFRQLTLECFDTCQLRPSHFPYAFSLYTTCFYRELDEAGESAYEVNKSFIGDFQKLLNIFLFYSTTQKRCDVFAPLLADLIVSAWAKEKILDSIWSLIASISATSLIHQEKNLIQRQVTLNEEKNLKEGQVNELEKKNHPEMESLKKTQQNNKQKEEAPFVDPLSAFLIEKNEPITTEEEREIKENLNKTNENDKSLISKEELKISDATTNSGLANNTIDEKYKASGTASLDVPSNAIKMVSMNRLSLVFSSFDRALLCLLFEAVNRQRVNFGSKSALDLCWSCLLPKLAQIPEEPFARFLGALLFGAASNERNKCRAGLLLLVGFNSEFGSESIPNDRANGSLQIDVESSEFIILFESLFESFLEKSQKRATEKNQWTRQHLLSILSRTSN